ncbi:MAG: LPXTG cell wall anchor domain-containing protein [Atopobiaceae bacterium]|jgi:LPXTG-motif cell wall-anchored protein|nr:LPXTG cell wall anchor domain-containing protein [Atopobiaceae bacterium]MCI2172963.1 LPXTG cell wall anchor domain-containing protein [Atopobiaceae bacterium]MCI2208368.1 LPXTG cell wall anchor domain-containing protein [Atopobiaceae bacterium]
MVSSALTVSALSVSDARRAGYTYVDASHRTITLSSDEGSNVVEFIYSSDPTYTYTVHYVDRATGQQIAADDVFGSESNLLDVSAVDVSGYTVEDATGWVSADQSEYTFYYTKDPLVAPPVDEGTSGTTTAASLVEQTSAEATPKTGDDSGTAMAWVGVFGLVALAAGLRRREDV